MLQDEGKTSETGEFRKVRLVMVMLPEGRPRVSVWTRFVESLIKLQFAVTMCVCVRAHTHIY